MEQNSKIEELQEQLKQANATITSQTSIIDQLKANLKEESENAKNISSKDWKGWLYGGIIGAFATKIIEIIISKLPL